MNCDMNQPSNEHRKVRSKAEVNREVENQMRSIDAWDRSTARQAAEEAEDLKELLENFGS